MTDTFATTRGTAQQLREMVREASAGYHDDVYLRVLGDEDTVQFLTQTNGRQVMSFCTYTGLKHVEGDAEAIIPVGLDNDTKGYLDYLGIAEGPDTVEMRLQGVEGDGDHPRLASYWQAEGALETRIRLPSSQEDLRAIPWDLPNRWADHPETGKLSYVSRSALDDEGNLAVSGDDLVDAIPSTRVETTAETIRSKIVKPAEFMDDVHYYPFVVEDGEFRVDLEGQSGDDRIAGQVNAESVEGPDVDRSFDEGFKELFNELQGPVSLMTAPDTPDGEPSPPLVVTQTDRSDRVIRHVLGPFTED